MEEQVKVEEQEQEQEQSTSGQKALYMFAYSQGFLQLLLACTTFAGGYFIGVQMVADFLPFVPAYVVGTVSGALFMFGIDGQLDAAMAGLHDEKQAAKSRFLFIAIFASIGTGLFTAFAGWVVGETKGEPISLSDKKEYVSEAVTGNENRIALLTAGITADSAAIAQKMKQWRKDTAAVLAAANESHARLYRSGGYLAKRYQSARFQTMQAFCANLDTINAQYRRQVLPLTSAMNQKKQALSAAMSSDVAGEAMAYLQEEDMARAEHGKVWKIGVWYADVLALIFVWVGFFAQRQLKATGADFNIRTKSIWITVKDWFDSMMNATGESTEEVTGALQELVASLMGLVAWIIGLVAYVITAPTRISRENIFMLWEGVSKGVNRSTAKAAEGVNRAAEKIPEAPHLEALKASGLNARTVVNFMGNSTQGSAPNINANSAPNSSGIQRGEKSSARQQVKPLFQRKTNASQPNKVKGLAGEQVRLKYEDGGALKKVKIGKRWYNKTQLQQKRRNALNYAERTDNENTAKSNREKAKFIEGLLSRFE